MGFVSEFRRAYTRARAKPADAELSQRVEALDAEVFQALDEARRRFRVVHGREWDVTSDADVALVWGSLTVRQKLAWFESRVGAGDRRGL